MHSDFLAIAVVVGRLTPEIGRLAAAQSSVYVRALVTKVHLGNARAFAAPAATRWMRPPKPGAFFNVLCFGASEDLSSKDLNPKDSARKSSEHCAIALLRVKLHSIPRP